MSRMIKTMAFGASVAALAAATPATAQYYGNAYPNYNRYNTTHMAAERCAAAVQNRLSYRGRGSTGIIGSLFGINQNTSGRVLSVTRVTPNRHTVRVRGVATSGRVAYNPYGVGAYGMLGSNYAADLSFRCSVDYRGNVRDVDINRR